MKSRLPGRILLCYLKSIWRPLALFCAFFLILSVVFSLYALSLEAVLYAGLLCVCLGAVCLVAGFRRFCQKHRKATQLRTHILFELPSPPPGLNLLESDYYELLSILYREKNALLAQHEKEKQELLGYYTLWVHQIKTPIAALQLLLQSKSQNYPALRGELLKIEQYVSMALSYLRLNGPATDYVIHRCPLDPIIRAAVKKFAPLFIQKQLSLHFTETQLTILTDEKWLQFVLEQLLSNAVKYTPAGGMVSISSPGEMQLLIEDTGIGIAPEDLPRILEKGFTGYNGRKDARATGLGLYLSHQILHRLSHTLSITSQPDQGTQVLIDLSAISVDTR